MRHRRRLRGRRIDIGIVIGRQEFKRQGLQRIAGQQRLRLAEFDMHRGLAAAQNIVVHAWHVVMDQRIGVYQFDRTGRTQCSMRDCR